MKKKDGVDYFLNTLRSQYIKGVHNIFLFRLVQYLNLKRGRLDISRWLVKNQLMQKRLKNAWMDLQDPVTASSEDYEEQKTSLREYNRSQNPQINMPTEQDEILKQINDLLKKRHEAKFPFSDNLYTLLFLIASQLHESQRTLLTSHLTMRGLRCVARRCRTMIGKRSLDCSWNYC